MRGLRTKENPKFEKYFALIQETAAKHGFVFFANAGDGNDFSNDEYEGEEMMGWLIPESDAAEFEPYFLVGDDVPEKWKDTFCWAEWENENAPILHFVFYEETGKVKRL